MKVEIRPATEEDAELMHRLSRQAWCGTVPTTSSLYSETVAYVAAILARGGGFILLVDGEPAGSVRYFPDANDASTWEIKRLGVLASLRRHGLGALLMAAVDGAARDAGVRTLQIGIRADQPRLIGFYERLGFRLDDKVKLSANNPATAPAITMSRRLAAC